jgi:hypothetical protein
MYKEPTLICFDARLRRLTRYVRKSTGELYSEPYEIVNWRQFARSFTRVALERFRLGAGLAGRGAPG